MAASRASMLRIPFSGATRSSFRAPAATARAVTRSIFTGVPPRSPLRSLAIGQIAGKRPFTTGTGSCASSFWSKGGLMAVGGVAYAGWKAANAESPMGQPVVECEAAVEADVQQLFDCA
jgi:hypothetical protein